MKSINICAVFLVTIIISCTLSELIHSNSSDDNSSSAIEWNRDALNNHQDVPIDNSSTLQNILNHGSKLFKKVQNKNYGSGLISSFRDVFVMGKNKLIALPQTVLIYSIHAVCTATDYLNAITRKNIPNLHDMEYVLYTVNNNYRLSFADDKSIWTHAEFHKDLKTIMVIAGFKVDDSESDKVLQTLFNAYRSREAHNFVVIEMLNGMETLENLALLDIEFIGNEIAINLKNNMDHASMDNVHIIGLNIGAHIAGIVGKHITELTGKSIKRITGLDPTISCLSGGKTVHKLQRGDANFVDVIHTSVDTFGVKTPIGDVDFYPNENTVIQPGCTTLWCSTVRAMEYFAESVQIGNERNFMAKKCTESKGIFYWGGKKCDENEIPMGFAVSHLSRGTFYLTTHDVSPFGKNITSHK